MKTYTETLLQYKIAEAIVDNPIDLVSGDADKIHDSLRFMCEQSARFVENELLPIIESQHGTIERLQDELDKAKDKIVVLTGNSK